MRPKQKHTTNTDSAVLWRWFLPVYFNIANDVIVNPTRLYHSAVYTHDMFSKAHDVMISVRQFFRIGVMLKIEISCWQFFFFSREY